MSQRQTRSSTKQGKEQRLSEMEIERQQRLKQREINAENARQQRITIQENKEKELKEMLLNTKLSQKDKMTIIDNIKDTYLYNYDIWEEYLLSRIDANDFSIVSYYIVKILTEKSGYTIKNIYFMTELLDKMRDLKQNYIFYDRPVWDKIKSLDYQSSKWWEEHIQNSISNEIYMKKLFNSNWKVEFILLKDSSKFITYIPKLSYDSIYNLVYSIYKKEDCKVLRFNDNGQDVQHAYISLICQHLLEYISKQHETENLEKLTLIDQMTPEERRNYVENKSLGLSKLNNSNLENFKHKVKENKDKIRYFLIKLIEKRKNEDPPLTFITRVTAMNVLDYNYKGLFAFIIKCIRNQEDEILKAVVYSFDIKLPQNDKWFTFLFECLIRPTYMINNLECKLRTSEEYVLMINFILKGYKININNVYMNMRPGFMPSRDPITHPVLWLDKHMPVIAWAVLYKKYDVINYLLNIGATLKRCAVSMQDLTKDDPRILKLFASKESKAIKIQRSFKSYYYNPSHLSQATRKSTWAKNVEDQKNTNK